MSKTAVIYELIRDYEKFFPERKRFWDNGIYKMRKYFFGVQYPDNKEEEFEYGDEQYNDNLREKYPRPPILIREKCLQRVVNKLENDGYTVYPDQLALFMSSKIDKLIMQKKGDRRK
jgi:hypothetical protein